MEWFIAVLAVVALGIAAVVASGGMGQMDKDPVRDTYAATLPDHALSATDVRDVRLGVTLRGYAMSQVDDLLDRLAAEIEARDARIAELTGGSDGREGMVEERRGAADRGEVAGAEPVETAAVGSVLVGSEGSPAAETGARRAWSEPDVEEPSAYAEPEARR